MREGEVRLGSGDKVGEVEVRWGKWGKVWEGSVFIGWEG